MKGKESRLLEELSKNHNLNEEDAEVVLFGFRLLVNSILGFFAILTVAFFAGIFKEVAAASLTAAIFRIFTGGAHANSPKKCIIFGAIIFNVIGIATVYISRFVIDTGLWEVLLGIFIVASISFYLYAPADTPGKPIKSKIQRNRLRFFAFTFLLIWGIVLGIGVRGATMNFNFALASCLGLLWQSVSLWPITYWLFGHKK